MEKFLGGVFLGVFVGAVGLELVRRKKPHILLNVKNAVGRAGNKVGNACKAVGDEFKKGVHEAAESTT